MSRAFSVLVAVSSLSLLLGLYLAISGRGTLTFSNGADAFSPSALGHSGLVDLLRELEVPVHLGRTSPAVELPRELAVLLVEPRLDGGARRERQAEEYWRQYNEYAWNLLLVLPAREGRAHPKNPNWVAGRKVVSGRVHGRLREVMELPLEILPTGTVSAGDWRMSDDLPSPVLEEPQLMALDKVLADSGAIAPVWWCDEGVLLARWHRYDGETFYILSDPDLLNNLGLGRGDNARLVLWLLANLGAFEGGVLVDETLHGHAIAGSPGSALLRPPLIWLSLHLILLALGLLWLANLRFGGPTTRLRARRDGKAFLIANTASLLLVGKHHEHLLGRYLTQAVREVARARRVPVTGRRQDITARLDRLPAAGPVRPSERCAGLVERTKTVSTEADLAAVAAEIHAWKLEMLHGTHHPARNRRPAA